MRRSTPEPAAPAPELFYRYVLANTSVHLTIMGLRDVPRFVHVASALAQSLGIAAADRRRLEAHGAVVKDDGGVPSVDCKESAPRLFVPEDKNAVAHGDQTLDIADFMASF